MKNIWLLLFTPFFFCVGCASTQPYVRQTHELLHSNLWMQTSAEYEACCRLAYGTAQRNLATVIADTNWTAATEQMEPFGHLPPAIILDIDETVLDNTAYESWLVLNEESYPRAWDVWCKLSDAEAVPGSRDYLKSADSLGVTIFYVTNRSIDQDSVTVLNLIREQLPQAENVLTKNERDGWGSDKTSRREFVAASHRVIQIFGDNFNDFTAGTQKTPEVRKELAAQYGEWWGTKWFMIPNPDYGDWEAALIDYDYKLPDSTKQVKKFGSLKAAPLHLRGGRKHEVLIRLDEW